MSEACECSRQGPCATCRDSAALRQYLQCTDPVQHVQTLLTALRARTAAARALDAAQHRLAAAARRKTAAVARSTRGAQAAAATETLLHACATELYDARRDAAARLRASRPSLALLGRFHSSRVARQMALLARLQLFCRLRARHESTLLALFNITAACETKVAARRALAAPSAPSDDSDDSDSGDASRK